MNMSVVHNIDPAVVRCSQYSEHNGGPGSSVGIAIDYELDGPGIESR